MLMYHKLTDIIEMKRIKRIEYVNIYNIFKHHNTHVIEQFMDLLAKYYNIIFNWHSISMYSLIPKECKLAFDPIIIKFVKKIFIPIDRYYVMQTIKIPIGKHPVAVYLTDECRYRIRIKFK